ncbi:MAG: DUF4325 domain-containing protein [Myxococcales bacterium]|nr:DUF4325 domain-containing protein [Myxococcales bacterium]
MKQKLIRVAEEFTTTPGPRYIDDGSWSGEQFRKEYLEPLLRGDPELSIVVDLDRVYSYGTSFLEEISGGLIRELGPDVLNRVVFITNNPRWNNKVQDFIQKELSRQRKKGAIWR